MSATKMTPTNEPSAEQKLSDAMSLLRSAYYSDVRDYAREIKQAIEDDEITDREQLYERIHETCDGTQWVIYTYKAQVVCLASDNDGAYLEEYGAEGLVDDGCLNWSRLAYAAMERDLFEQLDAEGVDVNGETKAEMLRIEDDDEPDDNATADAAV